MLHPQKILAQLSEKWDRFVVFDDTWRTETNDYHRALEELARMKVSGLREVLDRFESPGALPTAEFDEAPDLRMAFGQRFGNHQEARTWSHDKLLNRITLAVDGSQIRHDPDFNVPLAAVQTGWFINHHDPAGRYEKDQRFEILTPDELLIELNGDRIVSEQMINARRFELETRTLCELMKRISDGIEPNGPPPVAFFDSSMVISFADRLQEDMRRRHVEAMLELLRCSESTGIPLVGYVDNSHARDLTHMLASCFPDLAQASRINDAQLLADRLQWGDRSPFMICARGSADLKVPGVLDAFDEYRRGIGFVYLKTNDGSAPARIEIPEWVYRRGLLDQVLDVVRAEVIVGTGYPYVIESADAAAVLTLRDRDTLYRIFSNFAREKGFKARISQKLASKFRRR